MHWTTAALLLAGGLIVALGLNLPVAFAFGVLNLIAAWFLFGSVDALSFLVQSAYSSVANIYLSAIPFFILMGTIFVRAGLSNVVLDSIGRLMHGVRASGAYVAVFGGIVLGALMGASVASTAVLGSTLTGELRKRGYPKSLAAGPIIGSGTLANLIPPSLGAVLIGSLAGISISDLLLAGIGPAMVLASMILIYIFWTARRHPELDDGTRVVVTSAQRWRALLVLTPVLVPIFCVTGVIYLDIATPTEASATGALATFVVAYLYKRMDWRTMLAIATDALEFSAMVLFIVVSSKAYSQILAITGISNGFAEFLAEVAPSAHVAILIVLGIALLLGCFMDQTSVIFVAVPLLAGVIAKMGIDPVWFGIMFSIVVGTGGISPPFGLNLFAFKGVAPPDISMKDIYRICLPFCALELATVGVVMLFPAVAKFLIS